MLIDRLNNHLNTDKICYLMEKEVDNKTEVKFYFFDKNTKRTKEGFLIINSTNKTMILLHIASYLNKGNNNGI